MEKILLFFTAASAMGAVCILAEREYHFISERQDWTTAQSYCREKFTDLATVEDVQELNIMMTQKELSTLSSQEIGQFFWLGLYNDVTSWRWSMSDSKFYGEGEANFSNWLSGQPDNSGLSDCCTMMSARGGWDDVSCDQSLDAVCFDVRGLSAAFVYIDKSMTWSEAQIYCREHYSDLASVRNMKDNEEITKLIPNRRNVWIGLFRDSWKWSDGSSLSFKYWSRSEPNGPTENCGAGYSSGSGTWVDISCSHKFAFICYKRKLSIKKVALKLRVSSLLDINDPTVQEDIRRQLKQRLEEQGVAAEVELSWGKRSDRVIFHEDEEELRKTDKP
ncbi:lymphocyte antigen 75-like [Oryzias latipes]